MVTEQIARLQLPKILNCAGWLDSKPPWVISFTFLRYCSHTWEQIERMIVVANILCEASINIQKTVIEVSSYRNLNT